MTAAPAHEAVIGLEVHVQLATRSKLFCPCPNSQLGAPNCRICPVCTGQPGALPVLNAEALRLAVLAGLALGCTIPGRIRFDRKNYFYPDLPKGYQISQLDHPVGRGGTLVVSPGATGGASRAIALARVHLEEDAGKAMHPAVPAEAGWSLVDLNRAAIPLLEIVTTPTIRAPDEAYRFLVELRRTLRFAGVSECDMEKGSLRCDANISVRPPGARSLASRVEIKNLNSFRNVERALEFEFRRQSESAARGAAVVQETRSWNEQTGGTEPLRSKEEARDYRYFPDPDLPDFTLAEDYVAARRAELPESGPSRCRRYVEELGLPAQLAEVLAADPEPADYFDSCLAAGGAAAPEIAKYVAGTVLAHANERGVPPLAAGIAPRQLVDVVGMVAAGTLSHQAARRVLAEVASSGMAPAEAVKTLGLEQLSDSGELERLVARVLAALPQAVAEYQAGKQSALNALVGAVMKESAGRANPQLARRLLEERLGR